MNLSRILYLFNFMAIIGSAYAQVGTDPRSLAYSSYRLTEVFLKDINSQDKMDVRTHFLSEEGKGSGKKIPDDWMERAKDYMNRVNKRAEMSGQVTAVEDVEALKAQRPALSKEILKSFNESQSKTINNLVDNKGTMLKDKGFRELYDKLLEHSDYGFSNSKLTREIMSYVETNEKELKALNDPEVNRMISAATEGRNKLSALDERISKVDSIQSELSKKQSSLDEDFFRKKNLLPADGLHQLTKEERTYLLSHSQKPLDKADPSQALKLINERREQEKLFIEKVRDLSNNVASDNSTNAPEKVKKEAARLSEIEKKNNYAANYDKTVQTRLHKLQTEGVLDTAGITDKKTKILLLDTISEGQIVPDNKLVDPKINVKEALDRIPASDIKARSAFTKYVLENGSREEVRSLNIHAHHLVQQVKKDKAFELKIQCRRPR